VPIKRQRRRTVRRKPVVVPDPGSLEALMAKMKAADVKPVSGWLEERERLNDEIAEMRAKAKAAEEAAQKHAS